MSSSSNIVSKSVHSAQYFTYHRRFEGCESEAAQTCAQFITSAVFSRSEDLSNYGEHDAYQSLWQQPLRDQRQKRYWETIEKRSEELENIAADIVDEHVESVYTKTRGVVNCEPVGIEGSYIVQSKRVFLHVWSSRREARRYHEAFRRLSQIKMEHCIPSPIHSPLNALVLHQGVYVSVTWMPPLVSDDPEPIESPLLQYSVEIFKASLRIHTTGKLPLYRGADARLYAISIDDVMCHLLVPKGPESASMNEFRLEWMWEHEILPINPMVHLEKVVVRAAAKALGKRFNEVNAQSTSVGDMIDMEAVPQALHSVGLNMSAMGPILSLSPNHFEISTAAGGTLLSQTLQSELVGRALAKFLEAVIRSATVPEYATADIQLMQRVVVANQALDLFVKSRSYLAEQIVPIIRSKFSLGSDYTVSTTAINLAGVLRLVCRKLNCRMDGSGKQIAEFFPSEPRCCTVPQLPDVVRRAREIDLIEANAIIQNTWAAARKASLDSFYSVALRSRSHTMAFVVLSNHHREIHNTERGQWELLQTNNEVAYAYLAGLLAETGPSTTDTATAAAVLNDTLKKEDGTFSAKIMRYERQRALGKLLSGSKEERMASELLREASEGFQELLPRGSGACGVTFDLLLSRCLSDALVGGALEICNTDSIQRVVEASLLGSDSEVRQTTVANMLFQTCVSACASYSSERSSCGGLVRLTSAALTLHNKLLGPTDIKTSLLNYFHLYCLVCSAEDQIQTDSEVNTDMERYIALVAEMFSADEVIQRGLMNSDWVISTMGRLIDAAMGFGLWDGALIVLRCAEERFKEVDPTGAGHAALAQPLKYLAEANDAAALVHHYHCRTVRRRWNMAISLREWLHRVGVMLMEQMHFKTLLRHHETDRRIRLEKMQAQFAEKCRRALVAKQHIIYYVPFVLDREADWRATLQGEQNAFAYDMLMIKEQLDRRAIRHQHAIAVCNALDVIHHAYRQKVEMEEARAYSRLLEKIELGARGIMYVKEAVARRELHYLSASRTMQKILQNEMLNRIVPVLSLYFFNEEQSDRSIVEEEWATAMEELRLKERVFRIGSIKEEQKRKAFEQKTRTRAVIAKIDRTDKSSRQLKGKTEKAATNAHANSSSVHYQPPQTPDEVRDYVSPTKEYTRLQTERQLQQLDAQHAVEKSRQPKSSVPLHPLHSSSPVQPKPSRLKPEKAVTPPPVLAPLESIPHVPISNDALLSPKATKTVTIAQTPQHKASAPKLAPIRSQSLPNMSAAVGGSSGDSLEAEIRHLWLKSKGTNKSKKHPTKLSPVQKTAPSPKLRR